jgi:hypothetical protein
MDTSTIEAFNKCAADKSQADFAMACAARDLREYAEKLIVQADLILPDVELSAENFAALSRNASTPVSLKRIQQLEPEGAPAILMRPPIANIFGIQGASTTPEGQELLSRLADAILPEQINQPRIEKDHTK